MIIKYNEVQYLVQKVILAYVFCYFHLSSSVVLYYCFLKYSLIKLVKFFLYLTETTFVSSASCGSHWC